MNQSGYNVANQLTNRSSGSGGSMMFASTLDRQATVTVGGNPATVNHITTNFVGYASVTNGTNIVPIIANDYNGHSRTNNYAVAVTNNGVSETINYDSNGNETSVVTATTTNTYQWDAANRLVSITTSTNQSLFAYDGLGRRVEITEKVGGTVLTANTFLWCGTELCEERDITGATVTKRFFGEGEQFGGTNYFFTRDHVGSIREMVDGGGTNQARYDYDPYGNRTKVSGSLDADFAYAGYYYHSVSGLYLTLFRAYDSGLGRWLNRDPIGEAGGINLYGFVGNNPIGLYDPLGLCPGDFWDLFGNGLNNTVTGIGSSLGLGLYDLSTLQWSQVQWNQIDNTIYSVGTPANSAATPYIEGALSVSGLAAITAGGVWTLQAQAYAEESAAAAKLGPLASTASQAQMQMLVAQGQLEIMLDTVGADSVEWRAATAVARITAEQSVEADVELLRAQMLYQQAAARTASFIGF